MTSITDNEIGPDFRKKTGDEEILEVKVGDMA